MALANYNDLVSAIGDWLARTDLASRAPDFIAMAEASFNRRLRLWKQWKRQVYTAASGTAAYAPTPSDLLSPIEVLVDSVKYRSVSLEEFQWFSTSYDGTDASSGPTPPIYTVMRDGETVTNGTSDGNSGAPLIRWWPIPDNATVNAQIDYLAKIPALSPTNTTNWLLTECPDLYLYGSLLAAEPFLQNDQRVPMWRSEYERIIRELVMTEKGDRLRAFKRTMVPRIMV